MEYIIADQDRSKFLYQNHLDAYAITTCEAMADKFSWSEAEKVFNNRLSKRMKRIFSIQKQTFDNEKTENEDCLFKPVTKEELKNTEKVMETENVKRWIDRLSGLNGLQNEAIERQRELIAQLSKVDREITDCLHYIEFQNLNAAQGYKVYKMLKERRVHRRSIQNELVVVSIIAKRKVSSLEEEISKVMNGLDKRSYSPRELGELFKL